MFSLSSKFVLLVSLIALLAVSALASNGPDLSDVSFEIVNGRHTKYIHGWKWARTDGKAGKPFASKSAYQCAYKCTQSGGKKCAEANFDSTNKTCEFFPTVSKGLKYVEDAAFTIVHNPDVF